MIAVQNATPSDTLLNHAAEVASKQEFMVGDKRHGEPLGVLVKSLILIGEA